MSVQPVINFERENYKSLCEEMKELLTTEKELSSRKEEIKDKIISLAGGNRMEYGIKVTRRTSQGSVDYKQIANRVCSKEELTELEIFMRKPNREYWEIRSY